MKKYRVERTLIPYLRRVMLRGYHTCRFEKDEGSDKAWCHTSIPSDTFHKLVLRARCEKDTDEQGVVVVTADEYRNGLVRNQIMKMYGSHSCGIVHS